MDQRDEEDDTLMTTIRSTRLEDDNVELRVKLLRIEQMAKSLGNEIKHRLRDKEVSEAIFQTLDSKVSDICDIVRGTGDALGDEESVVSQSSQALHISAQLKVKIEMEVERRKRIQDALDDAEKRCFAANRALEKREEEAALHSAKLQKLKEAQTQVVDELTRENKNLLKVISDKELKIKESKNLAKDLSTKADEFQELFKGQLEVVKKLHNDLNVACEENRSLVKEMELLNDMFHELEQTHVDEALQDYKQTEVDLSDAKHKDEKGKVMGVKEILSAVGEESKSSLQDSCFKEVTTKNGTRMVLSVSKTFMKLKDLILEKKTLEDQMEKMKNINTQLSMKVNTHEAKLYNITDELNKTWNYVSTIKLQHKKLHTSEQILRAELLEKRQLLMKLREELEISRQNWLLVKQKTAESEIEWNALREEFKQRKQNACADSSESGFSDVQTEEEGGTNPAEPKYVNDKPPEKEKAVEEAKQDPEVPGNGIPLFIPSMEYMSQVPQDLLPPLFHDENVDKGGDGEVQYQDIYNRLIESTARSAMLASRLAEVNRTEDEVSLSTTDFDDVDDEEDVEPRTEEDSEVIESPDIVSEVDNLSHYDTASQASQDCEDSDDDLSLECPFPENYQPSTRLQDMNSCHTSPISDSDSPMMSPALWDEGEEEEVIDQTDDFRSDDEDNDSVVEVTGTSSLPQEVSSAPASPSIPVPPPPPPFSLLPPPNTISVRPSFGILNMDSDDSDDDLDERTTQAHDNDQEMENATAVTRFLIKHLPKQMAKLRNDKAELEDKIHDLETRVSLQNQSMVELERRLEVSKLEADRYKQEKKDDAHNIKCRFNELPQGTRVQVRSADSIVITSQRLSDTDDAISFELPPENPHQFVLKVANDQSKFDDVTLNFEIQNRHQ